MTMPPKPKFDREEIIDAAFEIAREHGISSVKAREVGEKLGCSSRPIFTFFDSMEALQQAVTEKAWALFFDYINIADNYVPAFKMRGIQMIKFAQDEPKLFQDLLMTERSPLDFEELINFSIKNFKEDIKYIKRDYNANDEQSRNLFRHLWIQSYGICALAATNVCTFTEKEINALLGQCFASGIMYIKNGSGKFADLAPALKGTPEAEKMKGIIPDLK